MSDKFKNLLFDLDGTIIDPKEGITRSIQYAMRKLGCGRIPSSDELTWCIGPPLMESLPKLLNSNDMELAHKGVEYYREYFSDKGVHECFLYDGIQETLVTLALSYNLFVATSKPTPFAEQILRRFNLINLFKGIYGSDIAGRISRKGEVIRELMTAEKLLPESSFMIGDKIHDVKGAKENNIKSCIVCYGYAAPEELKEADYRVESPYQISDLLRSLEKEA